ncbi:oligosaccharide flippase family protein [Candidatus Parcubacteria bacterium]|nr:oligosaccharide flippase family protein [Candidatus Parcubacteria bacterium]
MPKELIKNTGIYIAIGFLGQGLIFLLWIILAWWIAPSQIGIYALVMFVIEFFSALSIFGLDSAITRFYYTKEKVFVIFNNALTIFIATSVLSLFLFFLTAKIIPVFISGLSNILEENLFLFLAIIFTNSLFNFILVHYAALKKVISYARFQTLKVLSFCFFSLVLVYFGFGILGIFSALLFSSLLIIVLFLIKERRIISFRISSFEGVKNITSYAFPLMLHSSLVIIILYFSRILLDKYTDLVTLGVYSFFLLLVLQVNGLWSSFNRAWLPEVFSKLLDDKKKAIEKVNSMVFFLSFIYLLGFAFLIIIGELFLFKLILKEVYLTNIHLFYILLLGPLIGAISIALYPLYYYKNETKRILFISILLSGINITLTFFMIKFFRETGAAVSYFIMSSLAAFIYFFVFKNIMPISSKVINWTFFLSIIMAINAALLIKTSSSILFLIFIIISAVLAYKLGDLSKKKDLFFYFFKKITGKINNKIIN